MQITKVEVLPIELKLRHPVQMAGLPPIRQATAIFVRLETRSGLSAWGCTVTDTFRTDETPEEAIRDCRACAALAPDLNPLNIEHALDELYRKVSPSTGVMCAFDLAFHDLLSLAADMPLYRLLGGYRNRIQTSVTIPVSPVDETVDAGQRRASQGFRILKVKGGMDPEEDVRRLRALHAALPHHTLRLDADGGYTAQQALDVARALKDVLEMLEQPTPPEDLAALRQIKELSPVRILADQSLTDPLSALHLASNRIVDGLSIKLAACGGLRPARLIDSIARAAKMTTMISCFIEPALLVSAGLSLALSSPNVAYGDLDGYLDLVDDPSQAGFRLEDGWLVAQEVPGLGYAVQAG